MSAAATTSELDSRVYFGALSVVLVESNDLEAEILTQVLSGFKVRGMTRFAGATEAEAHLQRDTADLLVVGAARGKEGDLDEYDLIRRIRRNKAGGARTAPIILLAGHTSQVNVMRARDCGASFVVAKPITPQVLYERIMWLAKDARPFITADTYTGPDRRFQKLGPPAGMEGRRKDDLSLRVGEAKAPNLSQSEIDAMLKGPPR
ncbi:response regulator [Acidisphaera sp. L21]|uniref:response regulator n=1 Tax=Acidisphaera sp. L21 TaxID=1641851 RepID=UPI001C20256F|nr:response regulator [Acidisphaera sp. L21]